MIATQHVQKLRVLLLAQLQGRRPLTGMELADLAELHDQLCGYANPTPERLGLPTGRWTGDTITIRLATLAEPEGGQVLIAVNRDGAIIAVEPAAFDGDDGATTGRPAPALGPHRAHRRPARRRRLGGGREVRPVIEPLREPGKQLWAPTGRRIVGTLELVMATAYATTLDEDGNPEYDGDTNVCWDTQGTVLLGSREFPKPLRGAWLDQHGAWLDLDKVGDRWVAHRRNDEPLLVGRDGDPIFEDEGGGQWPLSCLTTDVPQGADDGA